MKRKRRRNDDRGKGKGGGRTGGREKEGEHARRWAKLDEREKDARKDH